MENFFNITELISTYGYAGIFIVVFLESGLFFALPGDSLLFTAGILAAAGLLDITVLLPLIFIATLSGGIFGYYVGVHLERLRKYSFFRRILPQKHIDKADAFFLKHGKITIILSRFVPIVRTFAPIVAGIVRMPFRLFLRYSIIGSLLWSILMPLIGYSMGRIIPEIKDYMSGLIIIVVLLSILPIFFEVIKEKRSRKR